MLSFGSQWAKAASTRSIQAVLCESRLNGLVFFEIGEFSVFVFLQQNLDFLFCITQGGLALACELDASLKVF